MEQLGRGEAVRGDDLRVGAPVQRPRFVPACHNSRRDHHSLNSEELLVFILMFEHDNLVDCKRLFSADLHLVSPCESRMVPRPHANRLGEHPGEVDVLHVENGHTTGRLQQPLSINCKSLSQRKIAKTWILGWVTTTWNSTLSPFTCTRIHEDIRVRYCRSHHIGHTWANFVDMRYAGPCT